MNNHISVVSMTGIPEQWVVSNPAWGGQCPGGLSASNSTAIPTTPGQDVQDRFSPYCTRGYPLILICCSWFLSHFVFLYIASPTTLELL